MAARTKDQVMEYVNKICEPGKTAEETTKMYDEWAKNYESESDIVEYRGPELFGKYFPKFEIPKDAKIIEIGCGTGLVGQQLYDLGYHNLEGLDGSAGMLAEAEKKNIYKKLHHHLVDGRLPLDKESYDVAILFGCIGEGHIKKEVLKDITEILRNGGLIFKDVLSEEGYWSQRDPRMKESARCINEYIEHQINDGVLELHGDRLFSDEYIFQTDEKFTLEVFKVLRNAYDNPVRMQILDFQSKRLLEPDIQNVYDSWSEKYDENMKYMSYHGARVFRDFFVKQNFPKTSKILDVGCGTGRLGQYLYDAGYTNLEGLDGSSGMLEEAKKKGIYKNVYHCLVNGPLPLPEASYDGVVWIGCVAPNHIPMEIVKYVTKIIKPGGFLATDRINNKSSDSLESVPKEMAEFVKEISEFMGKYEKQLDDLQNDGVLTRLGEIFTDDESYDGLKFGMDIFRVQKSAI